MLHQKKEEYKNMLPFLCRDDKIRTCDLYVPNVARYQLRHIPMFFVNAKLLYFEKKHEIIC